MYDGAGEGGQSWDAYRVREDRYLEEIEGSWMLFAGCQLPLATRSHAAEQMSREAEESARVVSISEKVPEHAYQRVR